MKRLRLYLIALMLLPQVTFAAVLVGKTEGAFSVSPSGAATYTIPIKVQNGLSEFSPSISLTYNSQSGNGIAGMGFSISGLSAISIVPRSVYFDGQAEAIYTNEDNAFALDGQRLLLKSGNNGQTGATYRTENEQYSQISITSFANGTPATFQVKTTDGSTYKYGNSSGRLTLSNGEAYQWALDYAEDALGNYIQYTYAQEGVLYPTSITYGRNTHGTAGVDCTILFNYENRTDSVPTYLFGEQRYLKKRLKSIVCKYDGNIYRTYTLNYTVDTFSHLTSVTEAGTGTSTVPSTTFEWEVPTEFQLSGNSCSMETALFEHPQKEYFFSGDLDGDGTTEIISMETRVDSLLPYEPARTYFYGRKWNPEQQKFEFCYNADTWASIPFTGIFSTIKSGGLLMHVTHGKRNSLALPYCRIYEEESKNFILNFLNEGREVSIPLRGLSDENEDFPLYMILDANKNGLDDIFIIEKEKHNNTYPAYLVSCDLTLNQLSTTSISLNLQGTLDKIRCADFNSDGMADLLITTSEGHYIYWNRDGSFSDTDRYYSTTFKKCDILETGDFNGDGLVDLIINKSNSTEWYIARNTGNATNGYFTLSGVSYLTDAGARKVNDLDDEEIERTGNSSEKRFYCMVQDIDGDGKSDAIVAYPDGFYNPNLPLSPGPFGYPTVRGHICVLKSNGETLTHYSHIDLNNSEEFPDCNHIIQGNFTGTAGGEIIYKGKDFGQNALGWYRLKNPTVKASSQKMISVTDGLGARDSISYGLLTDEDVYSISNNHTFPLIPMAGGFPVVKNRTESIPTESRTTNYSYANGLVHLQGKGFLGFEDVKAESSTGIVTETHCVLDSTFYVLLPKTVTQKNQTNTIITQDFSVVNLQSVGSHSYTINNNTHHETRRPLDGFSEGEDCEFFEFGFPTYQFTDDFKFTTEKEITYWESPLDSVWIKGLPEEIEITKSGYTLDGDDVYEEITYERAPSTGLILKETRRRNNQLVSTDGYSYNEYGQMTQHYTVPFNSTDTLVTTFEYYPNGKLKKEYDPKGLYRLYTYNSTYGTLSSIRDFDGVTTQYTYDGMLRETKRQNAIETLQTTRALSSYGGGKYSIKETKTGETPVTTYYDAWERKIAESAPLANGTAMYTDYHYLSNGKVGFVSFPHKYSQPTQEGTTYTYDNAHRLVSTIDTNGKTSTWSYAPGQAVSCIDGITTTTYYYNNDKISEVNDAAGWIVYDYNADQNISYIGSADADAYYTYDTYGRLTQTTDMNGVTKRYSYDRNGYPDSTIIAGSYVKTNYDKFGILRSKSWADSGESPHTVAYTYNNKYLLTGEAGNGYQNTYSYDTYGRLTHKTKKVYDNQMETWNVSLQYGPGSKISKMDSYFNSHPPTTVISEEFSYQNGYCVGDTLNHSLVWSLVKQDRWGHVTEEFDSLGTTTHSYDDYGNMLTMRRYGSSSMFESYTYNIQTGNMSSKNGTTLSYDSMNRLTGWGSQSYTYDSKGNITHQPLVGNFSYNGFRATGMTADSCYVIDDSLRISYYKAIERPKSIENEHYRADFFYDGDGDRYMMKVYERHAEGDSLLFTRYYMDANAEVTKDTLGHYTHLYYAGGDAYTAPAVMVIDETGQTATYQITRDNLGSAIQYASKNGVRYRYSYSPWGVRTHQVGGNTVFYQPGDDSPFGPFYRTYTGHEDLWMFGLINANARLYNPYLGRFISPDPLLNSEGGPLDYNPYIYARNNPYRYIDRNGEFPWLIAAFAAFATAGGVANVVSNWSDIHNFGEGLGFFCLGAGVTAATLAGAAVLGTVAACAAPYIAGVLGVAAESAVALGTAYAAAGAVYYVYDGCLNSAMNGTPFEFSWNGLAMTMATWGIPAGVGGYLLAKANGLNGWTGMGKSNVMATRHRPVMTNPDAMAARPNAGEYSSDPVKMSPSMKGKLGVQRAMNEFVEDGGRVLQTEVTIEVDGVRIRPDFIGIDKNGVLNIVEVKNGPNARFTPNQKIVIPKMMGNEHPCFKPVGGNAMKIPDFRNVMINNQPYKGNYVFKKIQYFD